VDTTPPLSPVVVLTPHRSPMDIPSSSSPIPPAVQAALDDIKSEIKNEIRNEFDELRADLRIDMRAEMNASGATTNQRIDELMAFMKELAKQMQKP
jgi:predicted phage gp36 major capsid-like protein